MSYVVKVELMNPLGVCLENPGRALTERRFGHRCLVYETDSITGFDITVGNWYVDETDSLAQDYIRRVYNLPDDTGVSATSSWGIEHANIPGDLDKAFSTEAEALEYVDTLGNPNPIITLPLDGDPERPLFTTWWREEIDGIMVTRNVELRYTGEQVAIYTINDLINFLALFFGVTPEEVPVRRAADGIPAQSLDCETYLKATIVDVDGPAGPIEIDIDFTGSSIGDVTVTTIDGDPIVPNTMIENGDGAVTIHDNGNIIMSNDGGTFFLNEFGNVGFYANNDASLTANAQVQLGVGGTSITVENDCFTFRDGTGNVELTADELTRLKALLD